MTIFGFDLDGVAAGGDDARDEPCGQILQGQFGKSGADLADCQKFVFGPFIATIRLESNPLRRPEPQKPPTMITSSVSNAGLSFIQFSVRRSGDVDAVGVFDHDAFLAFFHRRLEEFVHVSTFVGDERFGQSARAWSVE